MKQRLVWPLALLVVTVACEPASYARFPRNGKQRSRPAVVAPDQNEEQYEAGLADVCDKRDQERLKAQMAGKAAFYSEECLPITVENRRLKRQGEKKHFAACEGKRKDLTELAQKKQRLRLARDCFNLVPDAKAEVELTEPFDPIYLHPPDGMWKDVKFLSCKMGSCKPIT